MYTHIAGKQIQFDPQLIERYDRPGPRYTSYPTAAQFHNGVGPQDYRRAALLTNTDSLRPLGVYVHVPFCAAPCYYCGCNKIVTRNTDHAVHYLARLKQEITLQSALFDARRPLRQLHLGGGTPTFLSVEQIEALLEHLDHHFRLDLTPAREFAIEVDPRTVEEHTLAALKVMGFNRLSLGVQDFDPAVQHAINREQSIELVSEVTAQARLFGYGSVNFDLIYGLPRQTLSGFARTLQQVLALRPDRIAAYGYAHLPQLFKAQRAINAAELPSPSVRLALLQLTVEALTDAGYVHVGMDHFALPTDELAIARQHGYLQRGFQGYSAHANEDLIGLGVSAISKQGAVLCQNTRSLADYYRAIDAHQLPIERGVVLTMDDQLRAHVIQQIMCNGRIDFTETEQCHAIDFGRYFVRELSELERLQRDGLVNIRERECEVTPLGQFMLRNIAMTFDTYVGRAPQHHSQTL